MFIGLIIYVVDLYMKSFDQREYFKAKERETRARCNKLYKELMT